MRRDRAADFGFELLRESRRDGVRGDPARLRVADDPEHAAPCLETDLRQLGRLAAPGVPAHDDHAMRAQSFENRGTRGRDRQ